MIIVINETSEQLTRVLSKIKISTDIVEAQSFISKDRILHRFTPFQDDILEGTLKSTDLDELDTIVVPAKEDGFKEVFIGENCWYQIRISAAMLSKIKHIAAYQVAPVSAITHIADVQGIEKYKDTDKYMEIVLYNFVRQLNYYPCKRDYCLCHNVTWNGIMRMFILGRITKDVTWVQVK